MQDATAVVSEDEEDKEDLVTYSRHNKGVNPSALLAAFCRQLCADIDATDLIEPDRFVESFERDRSAVDEAERFADCQLLHGSRNKDLTR